MSTAIVTAAWLAWFSVTCAFLGLDLLRERPRLADLAGGAKTGGVAALAARLGPALAVWFPPAHIEALEQKLTWAGVRKLAPEAFIGIKALSAGVAFAAAGFLATFGFPAVLVPVAAGIAWLVPDAWLSGRLEKRQKQIRADVPMLVSLIVTALKAGIELGPALEEVGCSIAGPLGDEMRIAWREMATGRSRGSALRAAAERCGVPEFSRFVETIVTAEERGTPDLAGVLSDYMADLHGTARRRAEEEARKIPIKMNLPLIGCIFIPMVAMLLSLVFFSIAGSGF